MFVFIIQEDAQRFYKSFGRRYLKVAGNYRQPYFGYPRCEHTGHYAFPRTSVASKNYEPTCPERMLRCKQCGIQRFDNEIIDR